jgi:branched-chain amino acid transport system substrate-binding protein
MADAFAQVARARGVPLVAELKYDERSTTFIQPVNKLSAARPDAVFVPAPATQLELVAAQLAASGVTKTQGAAGKKPGALLCATADGLSPKLLASAGRYVQGALLAPVFYPDAADQRIAPFVERFRALFGEEPGAADALSFDAVQAVRRGLDGLDLSEGREGLARRIAASDAVGVTGPLRFEARGARGGAAQIYVVDGDVIHAMR